jgi:hypothetical protein
MPQPLNDVEETTTEPTSPMCSDWTPATWWRDALPPVAAAVAVGAWSFFTGVPAGRAVVAALSAALVLAVVTGFVNYVLSPMHAHCDTCDTCSAQAGLPRHRKTADLDRALIAAGWTVDGDVTTCRACARSAGPVD